MKWSYKRLKSQSVGENGRPDLVGQAAKETEFDGDAHTELMELFDEISKYIPNVAQGYLFSSSLTAGNETAIIANPTHVVEMLKGKWHEKRGSCMNSLKQSLNKSGN